MLKLAELAYFCDDVSAMTEFYRRLLDTPPVVQTEGMSIFLVDGTKIFLHQTYQPSGNVLPPENHTAFAVTGLDEFCDRLVQAGAVLEVLPANYYWGRSAYLRDPGGHLIELAEAQ